MTIYLDFLGSCFTNQQLKIKLGWKTYHCFPWPIETQIHPKWLMHGYDEELQFKKACCRSSMASVVRNDWYPAACLNKRWAPKLGDKDIFQNYRTFTFEKLENLTEPINNTFVFIQDSILIQVCQDWLYWKVAWWPSGEDCRLPLRKFRVQF